MPRINNRNTAAARKRRSAMVLGLPLRATGKARRIMPDQVAKRKAVVALGRKASATGGFRIKERIPAVSAQEARVVKRPFSERVVAKDSMGYPKDRYNPRTMTFEPVVETKTVMRDVVVQEARAGSPARTVIEKIKVRHSGPRSASKGGGKTFGNLAVTGRGSFRSRRSKRRGGTA